MRKQIIIIYKIYVTIEVYKLKFDNFYFILDMIEFIQLIL